MRFLELLIAAIWNRLSSRKRGAWSPNNGFDLGFRVEDGQTTRRSMNLWLARWFTHMTIVGKSGSGKSSFMLSLMAESFRRGLGFLAFDLHGEILPYVLTMVNLAERASHVLQESRVLIIDAADAIASVGFNPLQLNPPDFQRIAELAEVIRHQCGLDALGARTEELLRNGLYALACAQMTLLELPLLLTNSSFRAHCVRLVDNPEVRQYFELRYDRLSDAFRATMAEPVLNKITVFTADPRFRFILGQTRSTFSLSDAIDNGYIVIVNLDKGQLGEQAIVFGSLIFTMLKNAIFGRQNTSPFSIFLDEAQNFVGSVRTIETILSESRKKHCNMTLSHQFLAQLPNEMQAAILSTGNQAFFQLSPSDAAQISQALDGGKPLAERLKNLRQRHAIVKSGPDRLVEIRVPDLQKPRVDYSSLVQRCRGQWARPRVVIEREIAQRQAIATRGSSFGRSAQEDLE